MIYRGKDERQGFGEEGEVGDAYGMLPCMHAELLQLCLTLRNPMDRILPSSSVHEILQARILEWVAISFSRARIRENRIGCLTSKGAPRPVHYQSVPRLCKAFLTARLFNCETFRDHCSSDLISNMHLKDLSFGIDEIAKRYKRE